MRPLFIFSAVFIILLNLPGDSLTQDNFPVLRGPYLGQTPPGDNPEVFAPGIISLGQHEHGFVISPEGNEILYVSTQDGHVINRLIREEDIWRSPVSASFSNSPGNNMGVRFSTDGSRVYFSSNRPVEDKKDYNIWIAEKTGDGWSEPVNSGFPLNTDKNEANPSVSGNGTIYFQYFSGSGLKSDIFCSRLENGEYQTPEKLSGTVNTEFNEASPFIAPDESYIMFHSDRPGGQGYMDLYICFRESDGTWGEVVNLGEPVNTRLSESEPYITPDKKYLFYSNYFGSKQGHIYWVKADFIEKLKPDYLK